ncbi:MAG: tryptophan 2,3-dioxygenase family protein [Erythrobacter sp.]
MSENSPTENSPIKRTIEDGVETFEATIEGETIRWDNRLTYSSHLQTAQLLNSQHPVSDKPDEMLFIIMHQTMELWIKLMLHEIREAMSALRADRLGQAGRTLDRIATIMRHMIHSWEVLATLSPHDFVTFRGFLRKASGFQSHQYRELEFLLGLKRADLIVIHNDNADARARLTEALGERSLYDEVLQVLARAGHAVPADRLERDWAKPYEASEAVEDAWLKIYSDPEAHWEMYTLGEKVTTLEYYFQEWRFKHMKTVSRVIGHKQGTGGSSGVNYLVKALDLSFFPELWAMRKRMVPLQAGGDASECPYS